jgi:hypothetical protein
MDFRHSGAALGRWFWAGRRETSGALTTRRPAQRYRQPDNHWLGQLVGAADTWMRRLHGVREFTAGRTCLFRISPALALREVHLGSGAMIHAGDPVVALHLWNEHFPRIPAEGPDLAWAKLVHRRFHDSLCELAFYLEQSPESFVAVLACGAIAAARSGGKLVRVCESFGFEIFPAPGRTAAIRFVDWFVDFWIILLVSAFNPRSLTAELLFRPRYEMWMPREVLFQRFGRYAPVRRGVRRKERTPRP